MIKAVVFDCFGVVITDTLEATYKELGGDYDKDLPFIKEVLRASDTGKIANSRTVFADRLGVTVATFSDTLASGRQINVELLDYISELQKKYQTAMLSNVGKGRLPELFGEGFLEQYFKPVVASGDIGYAKPEAQAYEYVADQLGIRLDECVFTDDRPEYIEGARSVGMHAILFENTEDFKSKLEKMLV